MGVENTDGWGEADAPIRVASEDLLRRRDFADHIANLLSKCSLGEGRVFAIRGGWGFGKSSLKNLIAEQLRATGDEASWLEFNPWQWGDDEAITHALFDQIADCLGTEHSKAACDRAEAMRRYGAILTGASVPIKEAIVGSDQWVTTVLTNASVIAVASAIGFQLPDIGKYVAIGLVPLWVLARVVGGWLQRRGQDHGSDPLDKVRDSLEEHLRSLRRPLVVFVDDIDRLEPSQIRTLFRQIKANANLPNIVFVLLFQPDIVERALDPIAGGDGHAFLEKIVQVNFDLPKVPVSVVHSIFGNSLSDLVGGYASEENGFSQTRWGNVFVDCIQPMLRNLRDVRRLSSSIAAHMPLQVVDNIFEVNIIDFLLLETLRVFEPRLHEALFIERALILQEQQYSSIDEYKERALRLLDFVSVEDRVIAENFIRHLFPTIEWAYGGVRYVDSYSTWLKDRRVCSPRYFPRYFELQTGLGEISERRFISFLKATATDGDLVSAVSHVESDGLLASLVARIDESVDRLPVENAKILLPVMFQIAQKFVQNRADPFNSPWISAWRATSWFLKRIPEGERRELVLESLHKTKALSIGAILINLSDPAGRKEGERDAPTLDLDTVGEMRNEWLRIIRMRAENVDELIYDSDLLSLLYRWRDYSGSFDEPRAWIIKAIETDEGFVRVVTRMMLRGISLIGRVSTPYDQFKRETIEDFIGLDVTLARCDAINPSAFQDDAMALGILHDSLKEWLAEAV